jgi:hypothetical protein
MIYKSISGTAPGNVYPQTNNDPRNNAPYKNSGNARPLKHYRKGALGANGRTVTSSKNLISTLMDKPGAYIAQTDTCINSNGCIKTNIVGPNDLTFNPEPITQTRELCCNAQRKSQQMVLPTSTNLKDNYYISSSQYLRNRCQTYDQKAFNFTSSNFSQAALTKNAYVADCNSNVMVNNNSTISMMNRLAKVLLQKGIIAEPEYEQYIDLRIVDLDAFIAFLNTVENHESAVAMVKASLSKVGITINANRIVNTNRCKVATYKPNNPQFAMQGSVPSSAKIRKLHDTTISSSIYRETKALGPGSLYRGILNQGEMTDMPFILQFKTVLTKMPCVTNI